MAKADVENILQWKARRGHSRPSQTLADDLLILKRDWQHAKDDISAFADFVPIRIVTILEVNVREAIRELVDSGTPYLERAEELAKGAKIDFAFLSGVQGRKISAGDLVAHTISINGPERVIAYFEALIPNFVTKLKASHERWLEEKDQWPLEALIKDFDRMMGQLSRLFAVRHIVTHELPSPPAFNPAEIPDFVNAASEFITATDWVIVEALHGGIPQTQIGMNMAAEESMSRLQTEMEHLLNVVKSKGDVPEELIISAQLAWEAYADKEADLHASLAEGGSMYRMIWASTKSKEIRRRIVALKWWADRTEDGF